MFNVRKPLFLGRRDHLPICNEAGGGVVEGSVDPERVHHKVPCGRVVPVFPVWTNSAALVRLPSVTVPLGHNACSGPFLLIAGRSTILDVPPSCAVTP